MRNARTGRASHHRGCSDWGRGDRLAQQRVETRRDEIGGRQGDQQGHDGHQDRFPKALPDQLSTGGTEYLAHADLAGTVHELRGGQVYIIHRSDDQG